MIAKLIEQGTSHGWYDNRIKRGDHEMAKNQEEYKKYQWFFIFEAVYAYMQVLQ